MTDLETRLSTALADTARRNLPDGTTPQPFRRPEDSNAAARRPGARIRPWAIPALVAAVVVAFAVGVVVLTNRGQDNRTASGNGPAGGTFVTLRARAPLSAAELAKARQIISARAAGLGAANADVQIVGSNEITAFLPGVTAKDVGDLVAVAALEFRPLIVNQTWRASGTSGSSAGDRRVVDPWKSLGFAPPKDAAGYQALNRTQQNAIQAVIRRWDCRNAPPDLPAAPIVACDLGRTEKYLLGPAIVTGDQIKTATAMSPGAVTGQFQWTIDVDLTAAGQQRWTGYTAQHNEQVHPGADANVVADVLDGDVLVASTIQSTINGTTQVTGNFTQDSATLLADSITGGALPAPFDVVSVQSR